MIDFVFLGLIAASFLLLAALEIVTLRRWKRGWRWAAALPAIAMVGVILNILVGILRDSTAHNLWPFEILLWSAAGLVFVGILHVIRKIKERNGS